MNGKVIALSAALAATSLLLSACGSDSAKSGGSSGAGGSSAAGGGSKTVASKLILGGPAEFKTRVDGIPGLKKNYGISFQSYKVLDTGGPITVTSLKNGQVDAADLFTTDPAIKANNFVVLTDPKSNFGAQNVVPLINQAKATPGVKQVLNFISSKLTTQDLINLRTEVEVNKKDPVAVATTYLQGLGQQPPATLNAGVSLTVGSANFPENVVLADIYAVALKATGAKVSTKLNIGSREKYLPAVRDGEIDLLPEYTGVLLQFLDKTATATSSADVYAALQKTVAGLTGDKSKLTVLDQAPAEDADAIVVTKKTADKYGLTSIADLAKTS
jgi:glycine betaine/choline ABC-type transport system substrate-binding protein